MENKNIDRLFQEKFKDFEATPDPKIWAAIENALPPKKEKKRIVWYWWSGIAALFVIGVFVWQNNNLLEDHKSYAALEGDIKEENKVSKLSIEENGSGSSLVEKENLENIDLKTIQKEIIIPVKPKHIKSKKIKTVNINTSKKLLFKSNNNQSHKQIVKKKTDIPVLNNQIISEIKQLDGKRIENNTEEKSIALKEITTDEKLNHYSLAKGLKDAKKDNELVDLGTKKSNVIKKSKKWVMSPGLSQVFLENSSKDVASNSISTSIGLKVAYQVNHKWSFQSGVYSARLGQSGFRNGPASGNSINSNDELVLGEDVLSEVPVINNDEIKEDVNNQQDLKRSYSYLEIPMEAKYKLFSNKKVGLQFLGGFSTLILTENEVVSNQSTTNSSSAFQNELNPVNITINVGTDLEYYISKQWFLNVSPVLKVQVNDDNQINSSPYFWGIYSGVNFKF